MILVVSQPPRGRKGLAGQVDRATVNKIFSFEDVRDWLFLPCGLPAMLDVVGGALPACGTPAKHIVSERLNC